MSPITHLLASWLVAAKTTRNPRDCRLVTLAGLLPDADGIGMVVDVANDLFGNKPTHYYHQFHHYWMHGIFGAVLVTVALTLFAHDKWRVALTAFFLFHLHLVCDLVGSRGPSPADLWPIFYLGPLDSRPMWLWNGQWRLDGWENRIITLACFFAALWMAVRKGYSVVGVFNRRADEVFVRVLRNWVTQWRARFSRSAS